MDKDTPTNKAIDHNSWMSRTEILDWAQRYFDGRWINAGALETEAGKFADVVAHHAYAAGFSARELWIPIRTVEDLPKDSGEYLITAEIKSLKRVITTTARFYNSPWKIFVTDKESSDQRDAIFKRDHWLPSASTNWHVIAWRQLPKPYQEEQLWIEQQTNR